MEGSELKMRSKVEMTDAHCHLDLIENPEDIKGYVAYGISIMITDGVDTKSNMMALELADGKHVFAVLGDRP